MSVDELLISYIITYITYIYNLFQEKILKIKINKK